MERAEKYWDGSKRTPYRRKDIMEISYYLLAGNMMGKCLLILP